MMCMKSVCLCCLASVTVILPSISCAEEMQSDKLPQGSYLQTCREATLKNGHLLAICQKSDGGWGPALLEKSSLPCDGDIKNNNGELLCTKDMESTDVPEGTYQKSCKKSLLLNGSLYSICEKKDRTLNPTVLDKKYIPCNGDIENNDGELICRDK